MEKVAGEGMIGMGGDGIGWQRGVKSLVDYRVGTDFDISQSPAYVMPRAPVVPKGCLQI